MNNENPIKKLMPCGCTIDYPADMSNARCDAKLQHEKICDAYAEIRSRERAERDFQDEVIGYRIEPAGRMFYDGEWHYPSAEAREVKRRNAGSCKTKIYASKAEAEAAIEAAENSCNHIWGILSHEELVCQNCGYIKFTPDL